MYTMPIRHQQVDYCADDLEEEPMTSLTADITLDALKAAYHTTLHQVLGRIETVKRLDKALDILTRDARYSIVKAPDGSAFYAVDRYIVHSPNAEYTVNISAQHCTCPDGEQLCKHRLAVRLCLLAKQLQRERVQ